MPVCSRNQLAGEIEEVQCDRLSGFEKWREVECRSDRPVRFSYCSPATGSAWLGAALVTLAGFSWLFVLPAEHSRSCWEPLHRAAGLHRHSSSILRRPCTDSGWHRARQTPGHYRLHRCSGPQSRLAPRRHLLRDHDRDQHDHREPVELSCGGAHGHRSVLRSELPCDEARVCGHRSPPHQEVACVSCHVAPGATGWLHAKMAGNQTAHGW